MTQTTSRPTRSPASTTNSRSAAGRGARKPPLTPFTVDHFRKYARNLILDNGEPWTVEDFQLEVLRDVFAGEPEIWMVVPEGNGKSTLMSGFALYHIDYTPDAAALLAASSRDQCGILFGQAAGFVRRSPGMNARFRVFEGYREIRSERMNGRMKVFAADDRTGDGVIPTLALIDELHRHRDMRLYRTWLGKLPKRDGQLLTISTAGEPGSEFEQIRDNVRQTAKSIDRDGFHVRASGGGMVLHDWQVPPGLDTDDLEVVKAANPFTGVTPSLLARKRGTPTMTVQHWRRFVCNQAVRSVSSAVDEQEWEAAATTEQIPHGAPVWIGLDLGWKWDTTAIVPLWSPDPRKRLLGVPTILTPPRDGTSLAPSRVMAALRDVHARNPVHTVVMDPQAGGEQLAEWIEQEIRARVVTHAQSNQPMTLAFERWMEGLRGGSLRHPRDPEFSMHVLNAVAKPTQDGRHRFDRPSESRAASEQDRRVIDALIAGAIVHSVLVAEQAEPAQANGYAFL
jgi:phage terminase large subunit-like protein